MNEISNENILVYTEKLLQFILQKLSTVINEQHIDVIIKEDLKYHIDNAKSNAFQTFYFQTLNNEERYKSDKFFHRFKKVYGLQGIDNNYLDYLEGRKIEILELIKRDNLTALYFDIFYKAKIKHKEAFKEKKLGSFFAKIVHTFRPDEYCALDNPVKDYFGLEHESFFVAFFLISNAYKTWGRENKSLLDAIRKKFIEIDVDDIIPHKNITDMKLLDLIFWAKADKLKKQKKKNRKAKSTMQ